MPSIFAVVLAGRLRRGQVKGGTAIWTGGRAFPSHSLWIGMEERNGQCPERIQTCQLQPEGKPRHCHRHWRDLKVLCKKQ